MAEEDRRISLAGKVLVDKLDAQLLEVQKQGQVVGFGVALTMAGRFHRRNERSTTTYLLYSHDIARLISELLDAATDADPAWRSIVPGCLGCSLSVSGLFVNGSQLVVLVLRWWLGVVDRAGVKVERPERRGTTTLTPARGAAG